MGFHEIVWHKQSWNMFLLFETDLEFESYSQCSYCCCTKSVYEGNNEITLHCFTRHLYLTPIFSSSLFPRQATGKMTSDSAGTIPFTTRVCVLVCVSWRLCTFTVLSAGLFAFPLWDKAGFWEYLPQDFQPVGQPLRRNDILFLLKMHTHTRTHTHTHVYLVAKP